MTKHDKKQDAVELVEQTVESVEVETKPEELTDEAVSSSEKFANEERDVESESEVISETTQKGEATMDLDKSSAPANKSGGKALGLLALVIALGVGGAGYFLGLQKFENIEKQLAQVSAKAGENQPTTSVEIPNFEAEKAQITTLSESYQNINATLAKLERDQQGSAEQLSALKLQLDKVNALPKADKSAWLLSDADFLLNNAIRKLVLDNDIDTTKTLLLEADSALSQITGNNNVAAVREAIQRDLKQLDQVNDIDPNAIMQRLAQLANSVDDLALVDNDPQSISANGEVSDSIDDWQQNLEKSASSFLDHFIRISDRNKSEEKALVAPNQEIYLRENIRLRLQIAILTVPRQQNELYKQSLEAVSTWVRSYFDVQTENVKNFLRELDDLSEISIYVDAPERLQSLILLDQLLNKSPKKVEKIELDAEKVSEQLKVNEPQAAEAPKADETQQAVETAPKAEAPAPVAEESSPAESTEKAE